MKKLFLSMFVLIVGVGMAYSQSITITNPHTGDTWCKGSTHTITWTKSGTMDDRVKITLYDPPGTTLIHIMTMDTDNDGNYTWTIPGSIPDGNYVVRVKTVDNAVFDDSDSFTISSCAGGSITVTSPGTGDDWCKGQAYDITWTTSGTMDDRVKITLYNPSGTTLAHVMTMDTDNDGVYNWTVDGSIPNGNYVVRVRTTDNAVYDDSDVFEIETCGGTGPRPPDWWDRLKDILAGMKEIEFWRKWKGPKPWPPGPPCLSCPPYFNMRGIKEALEEAGVNEGVSVELFFGEKLLFDLGRYGPTRTGPRISKFETMPTTKGFARISKAKGAMLKSGPGYSLVIKNVQGQMVGQIPILLKEQPMR